MVRTNPLDLPPFFDERPRGMPTRARTMQAVGSARRRWYSIRCQRRVTGSPVCALWRRSATFISAEGRGFVLLTVL